MTLHVFCDPFKHRIPYRGAPSFLSIPCLDFMALLPGVLCFMLGSIPGVRQRNKIIICESVDSFSEPVRRLGLFILIICELSLLGLSSTEAFEIFNDPYHLLLRNSAFLYLKE